MTTYITFGTDHADLYPMLGTQLDQGYVAIDLPGYEQNERELFYALFGSRFAFDYPKPPGGNAAGWYRKGEIARIVLINEDFRSRIVAAIRNIEESRGADTVEALIDARDTAEEILIDLIGGTR